MNVTDMLAKLGKTGAKGSMRAVEKGKELVGQLLPPKATIDAIRKRVKVDHDAALELWETGRRDARLLATTIADAGRLTAQHIDAWRKDLGDRVITASLGELAARGTIPLDDVARWCDDEHEWTSVLGWSIVVARAGDPRVSDGFLRGRLERIRERAGVGSVVVNELMADALALIADRDSLKLEVDDTVEAIMDRWNEAMEQPEIGPTKGAGRKVASGGKKAKSGKKKQGTQASAGKRTSASKKPGASSTARKKTTARKRGRRA